MKVTVQVVLHADDDTPTVLREVFTLNREALAPDTVGLQLQEAKDLLAAVQHTLVEHQVTTALSALVACPDCGRPRRHKDSRRIVMRTLFGTLRLDSPRWWACPCTPRMARTFSPLAALLRERIAGKAMPAEGRSSCLFEVLAAQGMQPNQQVTFLTDGGEDIRDLPRHLNPQAEHLLDWFHLTMRITVLTQLAKGLRSVPAPAPDVAAQLQRVRWFLWHGNVFRARRTIDDLAFDLADVGVESGKLARAVREFGGYLAANASAIPNYGERRLAGETISTSFVESAVNQVISKRMVKKQQMRWSPRGAHLLLQIRTRILNDTLADDYRRWYPDFNHTPHRQDQAA